MEIQFVIGGNNMTKKEKQDMIEYYEMRIREAKHDIKLWQKELRRLTENEKN